MVLSPWGIQAGFEEIGLLRPAARRVQGECKESARRVQGECEAGPLGPDLLHAARAGMIKREESLTFCEGRDLTRLWADGPANE